MKIKAVDTFILRGNGKQGAYGDLHAFLVRVTTDDGLVGWGEADSHPHMLRAAVEAPMLNDVTSGLAAAITGRPALDIFGAWHAMERSTSYIARDGVTRIAMAAIDLALWDLRGKAAGKPVHALIGTARRKELPYYMTYHLGETPEETEANARFVRDHGAPAGKFGWYPLGRSAREDEAIVEALRSGLGADRALLVDGCNVYDLESAIERADMMARYDVHWFEEPLRPYDIEGYRQLRRKARLPITAGEVASDVEELSRLITGECVDIVQIDLARTGITQALRVAELAEKHGVRCVNHTYTLDINLAASMHLMAVLPQIDLLECQLNANELRDDLLAPKIVLENGHARVPDLPGLGVEPDANALIRFSID